MGPLNDLPPNQQRDSLLETLRQILSADEMASMEAWAQERVAEGDREALGLPRRLSALEEGIEKVLPRVQALENSQPKNAYRRKVDEGHHHNQPVEGMDDQTSVGFGYQLDATEGIDQTRGSWPNNRRLTLSGAGSVGPFCFDYLVQPGWTGTEGKTFTFQDSTASFIIYSTLAAAAAAASTAASTSGTKTIMVCSSLTEGEIDIGGLGTSAKIIITSPDRYGVVVTATASKDIFLQNSNGGNIGGRMLFRNIGLAPASGKAVLDINASSELKALDFEQCRFAQTGSYLVRQDGSDSMGALKLTVRRCTGSFGGFYDVGGNNATFGVDFLDAYDNQLTMTDWWDGGAANASPDETRIQGGFYTITNPLTFPNGTDEQHWSGLIIYYGGSSAAFVSDGNSSQNNDLSFQNIIFKTSVNGGDFCDFQSHAINPHKRIYIDNIFGFSSATPSGTFITIDTVITDVYVGDIHAPQWSPPYTGPTTTPVVPINASTVELPQIGSPTYTHVEHMNTLFHSAGWFSGGVISDVGSGNVTIAAGTGAIRATNSTVAQLLFFDWSELATQAITANSIRYVGVEYNAGSPQVVIRTTDNFDDNTAFLLGTVVNEGGTLHIQNAPWKIGDHASAMIQRARGTMPIQRDKAVGGLIFSESGTRRVVVTAGALWHGLTSFTIGALDTDPGGAADTFDTYSAGGSEATGVAAWPNTQYDNAGTLTNMTTNRWANLWWYLELDGELVMVYGTNQYTSAALAGEEAAPSTLPNRLQVHAVLAARFIFQKSAATAEEILSAFDTPFSVLGVTDHGNLAGLGDPDHDAGGVTFTPAVDADWDGDADPGDVDDALDELAARVTDVEERGVYEPQTSATLVFGESGIWYGDTPFVGTVNGSPSSTSIVYNVTSGENSIFPGQVIHNTTKGERVLIEAVNYGTNTLTVEANSPDDASGWSNTDALTTASQTNTGQSGTFVDIDVTPVIASGSVVNGVVLFMNWVRRNSDDHFVSAHPYEAYDANKDFALVRTQDDTTQYAHWVQAIGAANSRYYFTLRLFNLAADNGAGLSRMMGQFTKLVA